MVVGQLSDAVSVGPDLYSALCTCGKAYDELAFWLTRLSLASSMAVLVEPWTFIFQAVVILLSEPRSYGQRNISKAFAAHCRVAGCYVLDNDSAIL